jgi:sec-independent protein translocase protein TatC
VFYQIWRFVAPGSTVPSAATGGVPHRLVPVLPRGLAFCGLVALPFALTFLIGFGVERGLKPMLSAGMYVDFAIKFYLAFGLIFEFRSP